MRRSTAIIGAFLALAASTLFAAPAHAVGYLDLEVPPPSDKIVVDVITVNGTGCPAGTAAVAVAPDNTAFTVTYSAYTAQVGVGAAPTDIRKNCQLSVLVHVPSGFTYAVVKTVFCGFASFANGATATQRANYYFQGQSATSYASHTYNGPMGDDWIATDLVPVQSLVWSPCGAQRNLNINTELRVAGGTSDLTKTTTFISMDSTDGSINTTYHFAWGHCA